MPPRKRAAEAEDPQEVFARELQAEAKRRGCAVFVLEEPESDEPSLEELWALKKIFAPKEAAKEMGKISEELGMVRGAVGLGAACVAAVPQRGREWVCWLALRQAAVR